MRIVSHAVPSLTLQNMLSIRSYKQRIFHSIAFTESQSSMNSTAFTAISNQKEFSMAMYLKREGFDCRCELPISHLRNSSRIPGRQWSVSVGDLKQAK